MHGLLTHRTILTKNPVLWSDGLRKKTESSIPRDGAKAISMFDYEFIDNVLLVEPKQIEVSINKAHKMRSRNKSILMNSLENLLIYISLLLKRMFKGMTIVHNRKIYTILM